MNKEFSESLNELMIINNYNILSLAKVSGCSKTAISVWLKFGIYPSIQNMVKLADCFNCSIDYLLGLTDDLKASKSADNLSFADRLNFLVKDSNISFYKLSKDLDIDERYFTRWKKGSVPRVESIIKLAKYFNVSVDYLLGRSDSF